jgi:hypothetical protein
MIKKNKSNVCTFLFSTEKLSMSVQTIQFDAIGPIPLFPNSVSVLNRSIKDIASEQPGGQTLTYYYPNPPYSGPQSNVILPHDAIITEIVVKRANNPGLSYASQTFLTPGAIIKLGIVTNKTKYTPVISFVTDDLNTHNFIRYLPDPPLIMKPDTLPIPAGAINDIVLTAGFADITTGFITIIIKYMVEPVSTLGTRSMTTTVL